MTSRFGGTALAALAMAAGIAVSAPTLAQSGGTPYEIRVGTSSSSSSHAIFYAKMAEIVNRLVPEANVTIINTGGIEDNHALLARKQINALADSSYEAFDHYSGNGSYKGREAKDLRILFFRTPAPQNIIVREDANINSVTDLNGKPFMAGARGTTTETLTISIFDALGIKPDYAHGSIEDGISDFQDGRIVGINKASPGLAPDATYQRLGLQTKIKGVGFSDEEIAKIQQKLPYVRFIDIPANTALPGNPAIKSMLIPLVVSATSALPEEIAYKAVKAINENQKEIENVYSGSKGVRLIEDTLSYASIPLHAGVVRYFTEKGYKVPAELIPPEYKGQ